MNPLFESILFELVEFQKKHVWPILFVMLLITGSFLYHAQQIEVDSSLDQQLKPQDDFLTYQGVLADEFNRTDTFFVVFRVDNDASTMQSIRDLRDPRMVASIDELGETLLKEPEVESISSIASIYKSAFGRLPESLEESKEWMRLLNAESFFSKDMSKSLLVLNMNIPDVPGAIDKAEAKFNRKIDDASLPLGSKASLTGFPTLLNRIITLMITDSLKTLAIAFVFIFLVLYYLFRKLSLSLIAIVPVTSAIIWLAGTMPIIGMRLSIVNASVATMVIGLGVDYAIHLVNSFDNEVKLHNKKPITRTMQIVGGALFISFLTTLVGFSVNMLGSTDALIIQGLTLSLGVIYVFLNSFILIPVLLKLKLQVLREEHGDAKWK